MEFAWPRQPQEAPVPNSNSSTPETSSVTNSGELSRWGLFLSLQCAMCPDRFESTQSIVPNRFGVLQPKGMGVRSPVARKVSGNGRGRRISESSLTVVSFLQYDRLRNFYGEAFVTVFGWNLSKGRFCEPARKASMLKHPWQSAMHVPLEVSQIC
jgi:hypothetical protein